MHRKKRRTNIGFVIAGILFFCTFCLSGFLLLDYYAESLKQRKLNEQLVNMRAGEMNNLFWSESTEEISDGNPFDKDSEFIYVQAEAYVPTNSNEVSMEEGDAWGNEPTKETDKAEETENIETVLDFSSINSDYIGWIQIPDTEINNPIVQRDNSYYLTHDFMGENSKHGTIFLDEECSATGNFLILYGHHMKDGTMFGSLKNYKKRNYREEYPKMMLSMEAERSYKFFAGAQIDLLDPNHFYYRNYPQTAEEITSYLEQLKKAAFWYDEIEWTEDSRFVILSTCDYGSEDERLIIVAVEE